MIQEKKKFDSRMHELAFLIICFLLNAKIAYFQVSVCFNLTVNGDQLLTNLVPASALRDRRQLRDRARDPVCIQCPPCPGVTTTTTTRPVTFPTTTTTAIPRLTTTTIASLTTTTIASLTTTSFGVTTSPLPSTFNEVTLKII
jgi:hypothetical protein